MARRVFFSFHYERDIWRANVVRNSWVTQGRIAAGFFDASLWETSKKLGQPAIHRMIDDGLKNTSVTVVLIGAHTSERPYVRYEIEQSIKRGNGLFGVRIEKIKDRLGNTSVAGSNPLPSQYPLYRWFADLGYDNFGTWVQTAANKAGR